MAIEGDEVHRETDEARGGSTPHIVRWILVISTIGAIVLLSAVWIIGAALQGDRESAVTASAVERLERDDDGEETDGILSDNADQFGDSVADGNPSAIPNDAAEDAR